MKQKTATICVGLLVVVFAFGMQQAWLKNRAPFAQIIQQRGDSRKIVVSTHHRVANRDEGNNFIKSAVE